MKYRMDDGTILETEIATQSWDEERDFDGQNRIGRSSGSQWVYHTLYRSRRGRYYMEHVSQWRVSTPRAEWVTDRDAALWLSHQDHDLPADLAPIAAECTE